MSSAQYLLESRPHSVAHLFLSRVGATPEAEAYRYPVAVGGDAEEWRSLTWSRPCTRAPERPDRRPGRYGHVAGARR